VPGNHDVDRESVKGMALKHRNHFTDLETANNLLSDPDTWASFADRQAAFLAFTRDFLGVDRAWCSNQPWRTDFLVKDTLRVAVLCLNSAWASQDEEDERKLLIGENQVREALGKAGDAPVRIALSHHPLEWLQAFDKTAVKGVLTGVNGCHFLLRGHLHEADLELEISPSSGLAQLAAGACWQERDHPHSVTLTRLDFATRSLEVRVWSYTSNKGGFWAPDNHLYPGMKDGLWTDSFPESWQFQPPKNTAQRPKPISVLVPRKYREYLINHFGYLDTALESDRAANLELKACYVPLKTDWLEPEKRKRKRGKQGDDIVAFEGKDRIRPLVALTKLDDHCRFAVRGGPGTGKTTFLRHAALTEMEHDCLPILLSLKEWPSWLEGQMGSQGSLLLDWAVSVHGDKGLDTEHLCAHAGTGKLLWLLDGLDEIFDKGARLRAATIVGNWCAGDGAGDHLLITGRPHALDQEGIPAALGVYEHIADVLPLDSDDQHRFLTKWFDAVYRETPERASELLSLLLDALARQKPLVEMRGNPLLLGTIALVYHQGKRLPERRADLYGKAVKLLLERRFGANAPKGSEALVRRLRRGLETVAFEMFVQGRVRDLGEPDFVTHLAEGYDPEGVSADRDQLEALARELGCHSGLLAMYGDPPRYSFPHLGFQEYLAAGKLYEDDHPLEALGPHLDDGAWREVVLLTAGRLFESGPTKGGRRFLEVLQQCACDGNEVSISRLTLTMEAAAEAPADTPLAGVIAALTHSATALLGDIQRNDSEQERAALGHALGRLGDPRLDPSDEQRWAWITPGNFEMGRNDGNESEKPAHPVCITRGFLLGKYPVTNQEYAAFIEDGGYQTERWWSKQGWDWQSLDDAGFSHWFEELKTKDERIKDSYKELFRPENLPHWWADDRFNGANQPVVGINWFEAEAFCAWLTARLTNDPPEWWSADFQIVLPTEAQWEFAAKGSANRAYPWGRDEPDEQRANFENRLAQTSPVGIYPAGATPAKVLDMVGNVLEWCTDPWDVSAYSARTNGVEDPVAEGDPAVRCLRGGAWNFDSGWLAAACRGRSWAGVRDDGDVGFRCCVHAVSAE
jgi:formylglycine-generating enzyme required for sulfatase activity